MVSDSYIAKDGARYTVGIGLAISAIRSIAIRCRAGHGGPSPPVGRCHEPGSVFEAATGVVVPGDIAPSSAVIPKVNAFAVLHREVLTYPPARDLTEIGILARGNLHPIALNRDPRRELAHPECLANVRIESALALVHDRWHRWDRFRARVCAAREREACVERDELSGNLGGGMKTSIQVDQRGGWGRLGKLACRWGRPPRSLGPRRRRTHPASGQTCSDP